MFKQYHVNPEWDTTLAIVGTSSIYNAGIDYDMVTVGIKKTAGAPTAIANRYAPGAIVYSIGDTLSYRNAGSYASPSFVNAALPPALGVTTAMLANLAVTTGKLAAGAVTGAKLSTGKGYFTVAIDTNSTTPVNVFGAGGAPVALTVKSVKVISKDTTAGNIVLKQAANTVATIAKGTAAGAVIGATSLANTSYAAADVCTVESSSAGEATVEIVFEVA